MAYRPDRTIDRTQRGPSQEEEQRSTSYNRSSTEMFLRTNRIELSTANVEAKGIDIKIEYSLNMRPARASAMALALETLSRTGLDHNNGVFSNFEIVFILLNDQTEGLLESLYEKESRSQIINDFDFHPLIGAARLENALIRIPLIDILLSSRDLEYRTSITEMAGQTYYETYSEATINYRPDFFEGDGDFYQSFASNSLHLVGFFMGPIQGPGNPNYMLNTHLVYDLLLTRDALYSLGPDGDFNLMGENAQQIAGSLKVPHVRPIYYINDDSGDFADVNQRPYTGPVFRDGFTRPPVFRAGTPNTPGPIVSITTIRQRKVFSDNMYRFADLPGRPIGHSFDLSLYGGIDSLMSIASFGNLGTFGAQAETLSRMKANLSRSLIGNKISKNSFITANTPSHVWRSGLPASQNPDGSYSRHTTMNSLIGVKILDLLEHNTPFKELYTNLRSEDSEMTRSMLRSICNNSRIIDLTIYRRRVSSSPNSNNDQDTKLYYDFEENQQKVSLVSASDNFDPNFDPINTGIVVSSNGIRKILNGPRKGEDSISMAEVRLSGWGQVYAYDRGDENIEEAFREAEYDRGGPRSAFLTLEQSDYYWDYNRTFYLMDEEICSVATGKYTYDVEITLRDGTRHAILEKLNNFKEKVRELFEIKNLISIPVIRDSSGFIVSGFFDYNTNRLRVSQILDEQVEQTDATVDTICEMYRDILFILTGSRSEPPIAAPESRMRLLLSNQTTKPQDYEYFINQCENLIQKLQEFLATVYFINPEEAVGNSDKKIHVPNSTGLLTHVIRKQFNTGILIDADDNKKMLVDFGLNPEIDDFVTSVKGRIFARNLSDTLGDNDTGYGELPPGDFNQPGVTMPPVREIEVLPEEFFTYESEQLVFSMSAEDARATISNETVDDILDTVDLSRINFPPPGSSNRNRPSPQAQNASLVLAGKVTNSIKLEDYARMNVLQKSSQESLIYTMMQPESHIYGFQDKDLSFHARYSQMSAGNISVTLSGFDNSASLKGITQQALKASNLSNDYLTEELESAIIQTLESSSDVSDFEKRIEDNFKELVKIKDKLGNFYVEFNRILSDNKLIVKNKKLEINFQDRFKNGIGENLNEASTNKTKTPFHQKAGLMTATKSDGTMHILTGQEAAQVLSKKPYKVSETSSIKKVKVLKLQQTGKQDNIAEVNNLVLMEMI